MVLHRPVELAAAIFYMESSFRVRFRAAPRLRRRAKFSCFLELDIAVQASLTPPGHRSAGYQPNYKCLELNSTSHAVPVLHIVQINEVFVVRLGIVEALLWKEKHYEVRRFIFI